LVVFGSCTAASYLLFRKSPHDYQLLIVVVLALLYIPFSSLISRAKSGFRSTLSARLYCLASAAARLGRELQNLR
jgi:hypothetical protein